jgi:CheY-like chemotaxis protein
VRAIPHRRVASDLDQEPCMHDGSEFPTEPGPARVAFLGEARVQVLLVADRGELGGELRECLAKFTACEFELALEADLVRAAERLGDRRFDLIVVDGALAGLDRRALVDQASELARHLPVVVLSGTTPTRTPATAPGAAPDRSSWRRSLLDDVELPVLLVRTLQRARRFAGVVQAPVFFSLERFGD